jgi:hypothetical protein
MKGIPLWELAPDRKSIFRTFVAKSFAEGELLIVLILLLQYTEEEEANSLNLILHELFFNSFNC